VAGRGGRTQRGDVPGVGGDRERGRRAIERREIGPGHRGEGNDAVDHRGVAGEGQVVVGAQVGTGAAGDEVDDAATTLAEGVTGRGRVATGSFVQVDGREAGLNVDVADLSVRGGGGVASEGERAAGEVEDRRGVESVVGVGAAVVDRECAAGVHRETADVGGR